MENLQQKLLSIPCHFAWESLQHGNAGRTIQMNIENLEEHVQSDAIQGTEIESHNLMGFYKTQQKCFEEGRRYFEEALNHSETEDDRIVSLGCLTWLAWKEQDSGSSSCTETIEKIDEVLRICGERSPEDIPEVMGEKAFAIANSGFTEKSFKEALDCINKALQKRPDNIMYKYSKAIIMKQLYNKKYTDNTHSNDDDVKKIKQIWEELLKSLERNSRYSVLYGQALVHFAIFLNQINWDFGDSGKPYVEKAERVAGFSQIVMRNIAKFYKQSAGNNLSKLEKAEDILERIVTSKPDGAYKELALLGSVHLNKYKIKGHPEAFHKAKKYFRNAWDVKGKYIQPALNLVRLYQMKYDKTQDVSALVEAEKVIREIFPYIDIVENLFKAIFYSGYAKFLKEYGAKLAHHLAGNGNNSDGSGRSPKVERAVAFLHEYTQNKDDVKLLQAEKMFMEIQNNLEDLRDSVKADFHQEFATFLQNHSRDLAFCYFKKSLECNPQQRRCYAYKPLEELANEKTTSSDTEEQIKGRRTLKWLQNL